MEKIKSILSPGKHSDDEILYGPGKSSRPVKGEPSSHLENTGSGTVDSTTYGGTGDQPPIYDRATDSIPSQPTTSQEYNKVETDEIEQLEKEKAAKAKAKAAKENTSHEKHTHEKSSHEKASHHQGTSREDMPGTYNTERHNPYTTHPVDPRLGEGTENYIEPSNTQPEGYGGSYATADTDRSTRDYGHDGPVPSSKDGGYVGTANTSNQAYDSGTTAPNNKPNYGAGGTEGTASGQYKTRIASIIDPNFGNGVKSPENAYEHTPGGGGAYEADEFHQRQSRTASVTLPDGTKYKDPEADDSYGLDYANRLPSGVAYQVPGAYTTYNQGITEGGQGANIYDQAHTRGQGQPEIATTKSEAAHAVEGTATGKHGASSKKDHTAQKGTKEMEGFGAGVAGAAVADAGFEGTKSDRAHPHSADDPAYKTTRSTSQLYDVDVQRGNDYGKDVKDPRYGLPMSAAGISAAEAEALRNNEAYASKPAEKDQAYATQPQTKDQAYTTQQSTQDQAYTTQQSTQNQGYAAQPFTQGQAYTAQPPTQDHAYTTEPSAKDQAYSTQPSAKDERYTTRPSKEEERATKSTQKEEKSRRSSLLGFLHLDKNKVKKKLSKDDGQGLANKEPQQYTDRSGETPIGTAAAGEYTGQQAAAPGTVAGQGEPTDLAYRARQPSTADAPAFTGGLVAANGAPLEEAPVGTHGGVNPMERDVLDRGGIAPGTYAQGTYVPGTNVPGTNVPGTYGGTTGETVYDPAGLAADEAYAGGTTGGMTGMGAAPGETVITQPSSHAGTTGAAIAAGAAAGGVAASGMHGSQPHEGMVSDYDMQRSQHQGGAANDVLYDQVSPRTSNNNGSKGAQPSHTTHGSKAAKSSHKHGHKGEKSSTAAYGGNETYNNAAYGAYGNEAEATNPQGINSSYGNEAYGNPAYDRAAYGSGEVQPNNIAYGTYGNEAEANPAYGRETYGGKETQAVDGAYVGQGTQAVDDAYVGQETQANDAAYGSNMAQGSNAVYGGNEAQPSNAAYSGDEAQGSDSAREGKGTQKSTGVSRHGTKIAERGGRHVLHKDPPKSHPAAAMAGVE